MHPDVLPQGTMSLMRPCLHLAPTGRRCLGKRGTSSRQLGHGVLLGGRQAADKSNYSRLRQCVWELISIQPRNVQHVCPLMKKSCAYNRVMFEQVMKIRRFEVHCLTGIWDPIFNIAKPPLTSHVRTSSDAKLLKFGTTANDLIT